LELATEGTISVAAAEPFIFLASFADEESGPRIAVGLMREKTR
jgi:hypothetical protein